MNKLTYTYTIHKDDDGNIISINPIQKIGKTTIIETSEKYLDFETNYKLSVSDVIDILVPTIIFVAFATACMLIVLGVI